ncbi:hypothetical protein [Streptomyces sp. NBC_01615]
MTLRFQGHYEALPDGDFPDPGFMCGIAEYNLQQTVICLENPSSRVP